MTNQTVAERVIAHVQQYPGAQSRDIAAALGISSAHAANTLASLERRGLIESKPAYPSGTGYRRRFYPPEATSQARAIANRAQKIGGPFGLLVAQLTR